MGMFDSVMLKVKCPYCGKDEVRECQTKDFNCTLAVWKVGDYVDRSKRSFDCIVQCEEERCPSKPPMVGSFFNVEVFLKRGKITGKYEII